MKQLAEMLMEKKNTVVLTGAGVSTLSGIPDFRGKDGLYQKSVGKKLFELDMFERDPSFFYNHARNIIYNLPQRQPNIIHHSLASWERSGYIKRVITQNIDMLHQKAGSNGVVEVHGSPEIHCCQKCGKLWPIGSIVEMLGNTTVPLCPCSGVIKPGITFFGEALPAEAIGLAERLCSEADLVIVLGSSLSVYPAADLPQLCLSNGGELVIINNQPTYLDSYATLHLSEDLATLFESLAPYLTEPTC